MGLFIGMFVVLVIVIIISGKITDTLFFIYILYLLCTASCHSDSFIYNQQRYSAPSRQLVCLSGHPPIYPPPALFSVCIFTHPSIHHQPTVPSAYSPIHLSITNLLFHLHIHLPICPSPTHFSICIFTHPSSTDHLNIFLYA